VRLAYPDFMQQRRQQRHVAGTRRRAGGGGGAAPRGTPAAADARCPAPAPAPHNFLLHPTSCLPVLVAAWPPARPPLGVGGWGGRGGLPPGPKRMQMMPSRAVLLQPLTGRPTWSPCGRAELPTTNLQVAHVCFPGDRHPPHVVAGCKRIWRAAPGWGCVITSGQPAVATAAAMQAAPRPRLPRQMFCCIYHHASPCWARLGPPRPIWSNDQQQARLPGGCWPAARPAPNAC
jgi:hypothetical protein